MSNSMFSLPFPTKPANYPQLPKAVHAFQKGVFSIRGDDGFVNKAEILSLHQALLSSLEEIDSLTVFGAFDKIKEALNHLAKVGNTVTVKKQPLQAQDVAGFVTDSPRPICLTAEICPTQGTLSEIMALEKQLWEWWGISFDTDGVIVDPKKVNNFGGYLFEMLDTFFKRAVLGKTLRVRLASRSWYMDHSLFVDHQAARVKLKKAFLSCLKEGILLCDFHLGEMTALARRIVDYAKHEMSKKEKEAAYFKTQVSNALSLDDDDQVSLPVSLSEQAIDRLIDEIVLLCTDAPIEKFPDDGFLGDVQSDGGSLGGDECGDECKNEWDECDDTESDHVEHPQDDDDVYEIRPDISLAGEIEDEQGSFDIDEEIVEVSAQIAERSDQISAFRAEISSLMETIDFFEASISRLKDEKSRLERLRDQLTEQTEA